MSESPGLLSSFCVNYSMIHALTVDVEDYHNLVARDWMGIDGPPTRAVVDNTRRLLNDFATYQAHGTFFTLGEVAKSFPDLIREIDAGGHELAVHGFYHRQVFKLTREAFRREVSDAKALIEDITGKQVYGHRAPAFSIMPETKWALDVLVEAGFKYDSSIFPVKARRYGWPGFRKDIHSIRLDSGGEIIEAPLSTVSILGRALPACGGGYLRHFPGSVTRWAMRRVARERPVNLYMHPYEIETPHELPAGEVSSRLRRFHWLQQRNRLKTEGKIITLLKSFSFATLWEIIGDQIGHDRTQANLVQSSV